MNNNDYQHLGEFISASYTMKIVDKINSPSADPFRWCEDLRFFSKCFSNSYAMKYSSNTSTVYNV